MFRHIERTDPITLMERTVRWWTEQSPWGQKDWSRFSSATQWQVTLGQPQPLRDSPSPTVSDGVVVTMK